MNERFYFVITSQVHWVDYPLKKFIFKSGMKSIVFHPGHREIKTMYPDHQVYSVPKETMEIIMNTPEGEVHNNMIEAVMSAAFKLKK